MNKNKIKPSYENMDELSKVMLKHVEKVTLKGGELPIFMAMDLWCISDLRESVIIKEHRIEESFYAYYTSINHEHYDKCLLVEVVLFSNKFNTYLLFQNLYIVNLKKLGKWTLIKKVQVNHILINGIPLPEVSGLVANLRFEGE